jgi:hypothetical protein
VVKLLPEVSILSSTPKSDLVLLDSAGGQYHAADNMEKPVIEYMKKATKSQNFSCESRIVSHASQQISVDSGIAVISNALAVICDRPSGESELDESTISYASVWHNEFANTPPRTI